MRSRYSAFAIGEPDYLVRTWHSTTRPAEVRLDPAQRWTRLDILSVDGGGLFDNTGTVEFRAHYRIELVQWPAGHPAGMTVADFGG